MSRSFPFIQRRGFTLNFRIAVPTELRALLGLSEVTKALKTSDKHVAAPIALVHAAQVKRAYSSVREAIAEMDEEKLKAVTITARHKLRLDALEDQHSEELAAQSTRHRTELARVRLESENDALRRLVAAPASMVVATATLVAAAPPGGQRSASAPTLGKIVRAFLAAFPKKKSAAMFKKHSTVLPLMLDVIGDKSVEDLRQADLNRFFTLIQKLPPRWSDLCRKRCIKPLKLAEETHPVTMAPKTFEDTYKACVRSFLKDSRVQWQDEGFPTTLTTDGIDYVGARSDNESKQRAFHDCELARMFTGPELAGFAASPNRAHQYWLPMLGLYTGARVNELCQLNPQTDILQEAATGIWYFQLDEKPGEDARVVKSIKNESSIRKVPIHSRLLASGFVNYVHDVAAAGSTLLFPLWKPSKGRASAEAEKWFRVFLTDLGLRDETPGARLVGMHAFRHTLMTKASNSTPRLDVTSITGHAGEDGAVVRGYQGELSLRNKQAILEAIPFGVG